MSRDLNTQNVSRICETERSSASLALVSGALTLTLPLVPKTAASFGRSTATVQVHTASLPRGKLSVITMLSSTPAVAHGAVFHMHSR